MPKKLFTICDLALMLGHPRGRIAHACDIYGIAPCQRAGTTKLFAENQLSEVRAAVSRVAARSMRST